MKTYLPGYRILKESVTFIFILTSMNKFGKLICYNFIRLKSEIDSWYDTLILYNKIHFGLNRFMLYKRI